VFPETTHASRFFNQWHSERLAFPVSCACAAQKAKAFFNAHQYLPQKQPALFWEHTPPLKSHAPVSEKDVPHPLWKMGGAEENQMDKMWARSKLACHLLLQLGIGVATLHCAAGLSSRIQERDLGTQ
jgi:hypothetical protein